MPAHPICVELAEFLDQIAEAVRRIPGVGNRGPHAFVEAKSEITGKIAAKARELRVVDTPPAPSAQVATISPGTRSIGRRDVIVVRRARRP